MLSSHVSPRAVLLDRDGVINLDSPDYILTPEQWQPIEGSLQAIAQLTQAGIPIAIVSNQSAVGRGMIDADTFQAIHHKMMQSIEDMGGHIAHVSYCPHSPDDGCDCRKPLPSMVVESLAALGLSHAPQSALMIGDSFRDVQAAYAAGVPAMLVQSGYGDAEGILKKSQKLLPDIKVFPNLSVAVSHILAA
jgi:D-glycero-D-manno-heptose 1,7-bisphosphate phosphatase